MQVVANRLVNLKEISLWTRVDPKYDARMICILNALAQLIDKRSS